MASNVPVDDGVEEMETETSPELNIGEEEATPSPQLGSPKITSEVEASPPPREGPVVATAAERGEGEEDLDPCRPEGSISFVVRNFSELESTVLSEPTLIRNLPWRLLVVPRETTLQSEGKVRSLGVFVQCNPQAPESMSWNVTARASITLVNQDDPQENYVRDIYHCFCARENDWGYSNFMTWKDILETEGYVKNNTLTLQAHVNADAPHGINWDSRKHTGYVGLKNQGATCYMNSLLQTLYCTNQLRRAVYLMPTDNDDSIKSVPLALQRLFYELQHSDKPVGTKKLTKSFGWDTMDIFMQHDVQELSRVLLDNIESRMKGTVVEGTIPKLFEGKTESYIRCTHMDYESTRIETFFDIQLNIKGKKNVTESFQDYVAVETLDGENKYDAGDFGLQEAKKGVVFLDLPPVLHLHLMRFQYDPETDTNIKINDRYEFPERLDLAEFLKEPQKERPVCYTLHAVLVHSGDNYGGHYVVYLSPSGGDKWLKFDDDVVSTCSQKDAVENNFGGNDDNIVIRNCTNAYMLVYIKDSCIGDVLQEVTDADISENLMKRFAEEKHLELQRRKERSESHLYLTVEVYMDDDFVAHRGPDLVDFDDVKHTTFKVLKTENFRNFHTYLAEMLGYRTNQIRIWPFEKRNNHTTRPSYVDRADDPNKTLLQHAEMKPIWRLFVETLAPDAGLTALPPYDFQNQVLLFFKFYDPSRRLISYCGHSIESMNARFSSLFPLLRKRVCLPTSTQLLLFEEVKPSLVEVIDPDLTLKNVDDIRDGDIICFQRADNSLRSYNIATVVDYFRDLYNRLDVTFYDKNISSDPGFTLTLNQKMGYLDMAKAVGRHLNFEHSFLQFFRPQLSHRPYCDLPIRCSNEGCVRDFVGGLRHRLDAPLVLFYQKLSIPVNEFENKLWFHTVFVSHRLREEKEFVVYVDKNGSVKDFLLETEKEVTFSEDSTKRLRLLEIMGNRITEIYSADRMISDLDPKKIYRVEEVRKEEVNLKEDQALVPVAHFQKVGHNVFGTPFLLKITNGEPLSKVTERIKSMLDVGEKEFDKWKFAVVHSIAPCQYLSEESDDPLYLSMFFINHSKGIHFPRFGMPWLGLDHINKNPKRTRYTLEKAIKIHN